MTPPAPLSDPVTTPVPRMMLMLMFYFLNSNSFYSNLRLRKTWEAESAWISSPVKSVTAEADCWTTTPTLELCWRLRIGQHGSRDLNWPLIG